MGPTHFLTRQSGLALFCFFLLALSAPGQVFQTLTNFNDTNGAFPNGPLVQGLDGYLYGTSVGGGNNQWFGVVFRTDLSGATASLFAFSQTNGAGPEVGLSLGADGNLFGSTAGGGSHNAGTLFRVNQDGAFATLHEFAARDGVSPQSALIQAPSGKFYGTTVLGGATGEGTLFEISPQGEFTTLYSFAGNDGADPLGTLIQVRDGSFYGVTACGGVSGLGLGTVFHLTSAGMLNTVYTFEGSDGNYPNGGLLQASDGSIYGATGEGGAHRVGTIFRIDPAGLTTLHTFNGIDGVNPSGVLLEATDGNLYGVTSKGGANGVGTIFRITPTGTLNTLYDFDSSGGYKPAGGLMQATDGNLYGTTAFGGTSKSGTIFRVSLGLRPFVRALPNFGMVGATVQIYGTDLTGTTQVSFNGIPTTFAVVSGTQLSAVVPPSATSGSVTVTTGRVTLVSNTAFHVEERPR